jgi:hypothetical protein
VTVGHVIAALTEGASAAKAEGTPPPLQPPAAARPASPPSAPSSSQAADTVSQEAAKMGRVPSISFPPRRSPDGDILSLMVKEEAEAVLKAMSTSTSGSAPPQYASIVHPSPAQGSMPVGRPRAAPAELPPRREMTEEEIEAIMLGGVV